MANKKFIHYMERTKGNIFEDPTTINVLTLPCVTDIAKDIAETSLADRAKVLIDAMYDHYKAPGHYGVFLIDRNEFERFVREMLPIWLSKNKKQRTSQYLGTVKKKVYHYTARTKKDRERERHADYGFCAAKE